MSAFRFPTAADRGSPLGRGWSKALAARVRDCPREPDHRYGPLGYLAWHDWAEERMKTHRQERCECGLFLLLVPKTEGKTS